MTWKMTSIYFGLVWKPFWIQTQWYQICLNWDTHSRFIENEKIQMMTSRWCPIKGIGGGLKIKKQISSIFSVNLLYCWYLVVVVTSHLHTQKTLGAYKWKTTHFYKVRFFSLERGAQGDSISLKNPYFIFRFISTLIPLIW